MKCRFCSQKAVLNMRQHKLALCTGHFLEWIPKQVERAIRKYHMFSQQERILVAVSGGKDSLSLWDILQRLGYQADGLFIDLGIDDKTGYSFQSRRLAEEFAHGHGLLLHIVDVKDGFGEGIPRIAINSQRGRGRPCSVCGLIKRHEMNRIGKENGYDVLVTGHNLDDEAAILLGNTLAWEGEYLLRQGPVLQEASGLIRKVKPLCRIYEREMLAYALLRKIEYIYAECPYATGSTSIFHKQWLNQLEFTRPGVKLSFYIAFLEARKAGLFADRENVQAKLEPCARCSQPTSAPGLCAFCRLMDRHETSD